MRPPEAAMGAIGAADHALRLLGPEHGSQARREAAAMAAGAGTGVPMPRLAASGEWDGRPAPQLGWMPGRALRDALGRRPWAALELGTAFGRCQTAVHAAPAPPGLLDHPVPWPEWADPDRLVADAEVGRDLPQRPALRPQGVDDG